jgi:hypothetical protein
MKRACAQVACEVVRVKFFLWNSLIFENISKMHLK